MKLSQKVALISLSVLSSQAAFAIQADFYGFIKASYLHSNNSVSSYGVDSIQAPTEAANLDVGTPIQEEGYRQQSKDSFQVAQSRFGFTLKKSDNLSGKFEFDLVDFTNHPIGKNDARVRIAEIYYKFSPALSMRVGQGWSTFAGVNPHTFNYVGGNYRSGGTGFLSQQAELKYTLGQISYVGSIAQKGRNTSGHTNVVAGGSSATQQDVSSRGLPQFNGKVEYNNDTQKLGAAYTYARFDFENDQDTTVRNYETHSYGGKVYYQGKYSKLEVRSEIYMGANLNDLYMLSLAERGHAVAATQKDRDFEERGAYVSARYALEGGHSVYGGYGVAQITEDEENIAADKILANAAARLGYSHLIEEGFTAFVEGTYYDTKYKKGAGDETTAFQTALVEVGLNYAF